MKPVEIFHRLILWYRIIEMEASDLPISLRFIVLVNIFTIFDVASAGY